MSSYSGYALVLSAVFLAVAAEAPLPSFNQQLLRQQPQQQRRPVIPILRHHETRDDSGQFALQYVSADGAHFTEQGILKPTEDGKDHVLVKKGTYGYTSPEGVPIRVSYYADETGFHPESDSLPLAPADISRRHRH